MADVIIPVSLILCLIFVVGNSAPSQTIGKNEAGDIPDNSHNEMSTNNGPQTTTSFHINYSKTSPSATSDVALKLSTPKRVTESIEVSLKGNRTKGSVKTDTIKERGASRKAETKGNVMSLTDDVITDALFTNIDTLQDHLEVCEEGLRQQLRLHSEGRLLQDVDEDDDNSFTDGEINYQKNGAATSDFNKDSKVNTVDRGFEDTSSDDVDKISVDSESHFTDAVGESFKELKEDLVRRRRSVSEINNEDKIDSKVDYLAQKVVQRLSARLEYLRSSVLQCHLLYKQLGSL